MPDFLIRTVAPLVVGAVCFYCFSVAYAISGLVFTLIQFVVMDMSKPPSDLAVAIVRGSGGVVAFALSFGLGVFVMTDMPFYPEPRALEASVMLAFFGTGYLSPVVWIFTQDYQSGQGWSQADSVIIGLGMAAGLVCSYLVRMMLARKKSVAAAYSQGQE